jgi:hypothetical protein
MCLFDGVVNSLSFVKVWKSLFIFKFDIVKKKKIVLINESVITIICINSLCYHSLILILMVNPGILYIEKLFQVQPNLAYCHLY